MQKIPTIRKKEAFIESLQVFLSEGLMAQRIELRDINGHLIGALFMYSDDAVYWNALCAIEV